MHEGEKRNSFRILVRKPEGKRALGRTRNKWIILKWVLDKWDGVVWTAFIWFRIGTRQALLNTVMKFWSHKMLGNSGVAE
jgi:hypothetical protein